MHDSRPGTAGCQYNEIILWGHVWDAHLPQIVEAFFYPINGHVDSREGDAWKASEEREAFIARFRPAAFAPLLTYDVAKSQRGEAPWDVAPSIKRP